MTSRTCSFAMALLLMACTGRSGEAIGERAGGVEPSWNVPPHTCLTGAPRMDLSADGSITQFCHDGMHLQDTSKQWHANSQKAAQGDFFDGKRIGVWKWWHDNGQMAIRGTYEADEKTGTWTWWHANGQTQMRGDHADGKRMGVWQTWYATGQLQRSGHFRNGREDGVWETWTNEGELARKQTYELGRLVTEKVLIEPEAKPE